MIHWFRRANLEAAPHHWGEVEPLKCKMLKCESTALLTIVIVGTIQYNKIQYKTTQKASNFLIKEMLAIITMLESNTHSDLCTTASFIIVATNTH